jgi:uncharacterized protein
MHDSSIPPPLIGWPLLPQPDGQGYLSYPSLEQSVRQTIQVILRTRPGEQLMRPEFGAGLDNFLHQPNTLATRRQLHDTIEQALQLWEPRIMVDLVDVAEVPNQPSQIRIEIAYRLRRNGSGQRIGATMELTS